MTEHNETEIKLDHEGFVVLEDARVPVVLYKEPYGERIFVRSLLYIIQTVYDQTWDGTKKSCVVEVELYDEGAVNVRMLSQSYWGPHDIKAYVNRFINLKHPYEEVIDVAAN